MSSTSREQLEPTEHHGFQVVEFGPVDYDAITEIEVIENDDLESLIVPFADFKPPASSVAKYNPGAFRSPLRVGPGVCRGARPRASRGRPVKRRGSRRTSAPTRAGPDESGDPDPDGEHHPLAARETAGVAL
jgi:hypothetical protein